MEEKMMMMMMKDRRKKGLGSVPSRAEAPEWFISPGHGEIRDTGTPIRVIAHLSLSLSLSLSLPPSLSLSLLYLPISHSLYIAQPPTS